MRTKKIAASQTSRLQTGAAVLAAARTLDTRPIQARLTRFGRAQQGYLDAHRKVEVAEAQLRAARAGVAARDAEQDRAVEALACALVNDGQPRISPFAAFGAPSPNALAHLPVRDQAQAVHALVGALQRHAGISKATLQSAQALDKATRAVEQALEPVATLEADVRGARQKRTAVLQAWNTTLAALKRDARSAADEGAPLIYATLFGTTTRTNGKHAKPAPSPLPVAPPTPAVPPQPEPAV